MLWKLHKTICVLYLTIIQQRIINYCFKETSIIVSPLLRYPCCFQIRNQGKKKKKSVAEYWDAGTQWAVRICDKVDQCYISSILKNPY